MSAGVIARDSSLRLPNGIQPVFLRGMGGCQISNNPRGTPRNRVEELTPNDPIDRLDLLILRRYPRHTFTSKLWKGSIAAACGCDESGLIGVILWGDQVDRVCTGDVISIQGGWCRYEYDQKVVSAGRKGQLTVLEV